MSKLILASFEEYQKERVQFVQAIAELARQPQNIEPLQERGIMKLLRPLLLDNVSSIQQSAALALARLASYSSTMAEAIVTDQILPQLIDSLSRQNRFYKRAASYVLKSVAQHSEHLARCVMDAGGVEPLVQCLEEFDPNVKEGAAFALSQVAKYCRPHHRHENKELAEEVAKAGAVERLSYCVQDPDINLKKVAANALGEIGKHSVELAERVAKCPGTLKALTAALGGRDLELRCNACGCLGSLAKHSEEIAHLIVDANLFPGIINYGLKEDKSVLQREAMQCIKEIVCHSAELAKVAAEANVIEPIIDYLNKNGSASRLPGIMCLGFISGYSKDLATAIVRGKGHIALIRCLKAPKQPHVQSAAAWCLGQIAKNSKELTHELEKAKVTDALLQTYLKAQEGSDLKAKCRRALRHMIEQAQELCTLATLIPSAPEKVLKRVVAQIAKLLKEHPELKKTFADDGYLSILQGVKTDPDGKLAAAIKEVNALYPDEVVQYFTEGIMEEMLKEDEQAP